MSADIPTILVHDLVRLWDAGVAGSVSDDDYNDEMCRIEAGMRAIVSRPAVVSEGQAVAVLDIDSERTKFEVAINDARFFPRELNFAQTKSPGGRDEYANGFMESAWQGWKLARRPAAPAPEAPHPIAGLGSITNDENGFISLRFESEDAAQAFMQAYNPTVDCRDMPAWPDDREAAAQASPAKADLSGLTSYCRTSRVPCPDGGVEYEYFYAATDVEALLKNSGGV